MSLVCLIKTLGNMKAVVPLLLMLLTSVLGDEAWKKPGCHLLGTYFICNIQLH